MATEGKNHSFDLLYFFLISPFPGLFAFRIPHSTFFYSPTLLLVQCDEDYSAAHAERHYSYLL